VWGDGTESQLGHYPYERKGMMNTYAELVPRELFLDDAPLVFRQIACGTNHTLAIDDAGAVWAWGKADYGKLGFSSAEKNEDQPFPRKVEALAGVEAESVACGDFHSAVVDTSGRLWTWGWGGGWLSGGGHLGHGDRADKPTPTLVTTLDDGGYRIKSVSCGEAHTLILTDDGEALSCGAGEHGRNGNGASGDVLVPEPVLAFEDLDVVQLEAGAAFSVARTSGNDVFVWGRNDQGQLGLGGGLAMDVYAMEDTPRTVELAPVPPGTAPTDDAPPPTSGEPTPLKASHITAGNAHAAAVSEDGRLFFWGMKAHLEPTQLHFEHKIHTPLAVYAGGNFTLVHATDGSLHSFGLGRTNCLGHGNRAGLSHPTHILAFDDYTNLSCVAPGFRHVALLCERKKPQEEASS